MDDMENTARPTETVKASTEFHQHSVIPPVANPGHTLQQGCVPGLNPGWNGRKDISYKEFGTHRTAGQMRSNRRIGGGSSLVTDHIMEMTCYIVFGQNGPSSCDKKGHALLDGMSPGAGNYA